MVTIKDIAKNLGVSYSTVSRCLNDSPSVSEKTKKKVQEEALRLGFHFNVNARNLVKQETNTIGVIFSDNFNDRDMRKFFGDIMESSINAIEFNKYDFIIQPNHNIRGNSNIYKMVNGRMVDGLVIVSRSITKEEYDFLINSKIPHVFIYFKPLFIEGEMDNFFWDDNEYGGYIATKYLINHGHKKILTITSDDDSLTMYKDRTKGYLNAINEANLIPDIIRVRMDFDSQIELVKNNIDKIKNSTAIFVQQDTPAISIIQELKTVYNIEIPKDISIVGYNNIELISYFKTDLTTVDDPREEVIKNGIDVLVNKINKKEDKHIIRKLYPRIIKRSSVRII
ncbi:LacI family transcriptional regulator [Paraclostridium benzoelyticum]|uniref:LacI family transcriptional regulator n=1 Tax=Paraclostridium benzoelyticum TaxID=1629550 RepID=A0A0M3DD60_9FIRM|nr:LacI family DNA-binding transcriptional regulator [Paraclostridium benzoelyticum]KKY00585.1 LacI family transcriptional regulator [Paraclostridium benzoelyticum]